MPTWDFSCPDCGACEERWYNNPKDVPQRWPCVCGKFLVRQIGAGGGVIFRGPGFYTTEHRQAPPETASGNSEGA